MSQANLDLNAARWSVEVVHDSQALPLVQRTIEDDPEPTVSARDLHAFLRVGRDFSNWIKDRIQEYGFRDGADFITSIGLSSPNSASAKARPQRVTEYHLSLGTAKELSMVERNDRGREARRYFIACEQRLRDELKRPPADPLVALSDPTILRALLLQSSDRLVNAEAKLAAIANAPPALSPPEDRLYTVEEAAAHLGMSPAYLWDELVRLEWVWKSYRRHGMPVAEIAREEAIARGVVLPIFSATDDNRRNPSGARVRVALTANGLHRLIAVHAH